MLAFFTVVRDRSGNYGRNPFWFTDRHWKREHCSLRSLSSIYHNHRHLSIDHHQLSSIIYWSYHHRRPVLSSSVDHRRPGLVSLWSSSVSPGIIYIIVVSLDRLVYRRHLSYHHDDQPSMIICHHRHPRHFLSDAEQPCASPHWPRSLLQPSLTTQLLQVANHFFYSFVAQNSIFF